MRYSILISLLLIFLFIITGISFTLGKYPVGLCDIFGLLLLKTFNGEVMDEQKQQLLQNIIIDIRMPRIIAAMLIGAALSTSGAAFQSMFMNPLVSPGLLGTLSGASFGAALGMLFLKNWFMVQTSSFIFAFLAVMIAIGIAKLYNGATILMLVLGGIISGSLFTSLLSVIKYIADPYNQLPSIVYWLMGGLSNVDKQTVFFLSIPILIGITALLLLSHHLNVLSMGDEEAKSLGVNVTFIRMVIIFFATLISALTVVIGGMIGWIGLVVPHIARMITGPNNKMLLPAAALIGGIYLLIVDDISRLLFSTEVPLGILTALIGIPFFVWVLKNAKRGWG